MQPAFPLSSYMPVSVFSPLRSTARWVVIMEEQLAALLISRGKGLIIDTSVVLLELIFCLVLVCLRCLARLDSYSLPINPMAAVRRLELLVLTLVAVAPRCIPWCAVPWEPVSGTQALTLATGLAWGTSKSPDGFKQSFPTPAVCTQHTYMFAKVCMHQLLRCFAQSVRELF